jgi:hypothetical protein
MSLADQLFAEMAVPVLMASSGDAASVYLTPRGGQRSGPYDAILENEGQREVDNDSGRTYVHERTLKFPLQNGLPFWSGQSLVGLVATIAGVEWAVELVDDLSPTWATVKLVRKAASEVSRPGYRKR